MKGFIAEAAPRRFRQFGEESLARKLVLALAGIAAALATSRATAAEWRVYHNDRFGATADYPAGWKMEPAPVNDDGRVFTSPDGKARVTISGIFAINPREEEITEKAQPLAGEKVTYRAHKGDWIVVSGTRGGAIFYRKSLISCDNKVWNDVEVVYPATEKAKYDPLVAHIAASLKPGSGYHLQCK